MKYLVIISTLFAIGSLIGWIIELFFRRFVSQKKWMNPGFLTGPYLPIYGFGVLVLYGVSNLSSLNYNTLTSIDGIKQTKACNILAAIELSNRINNCIRDLNGTKLNNAEVVYNYYKNILKDESQECFYCVYLDVTKKVIKDKLLFKGTLNYSLVHPRDVFKEAYLLNATAIICVHNHPSGNLSPSPQDIEITNNLVELGIIHGIKVLDHIIISDNSYYSFLENNKISL